MESSMTYSPDTPPVSAIIETSPGVFELNAPAFITHVLRQEWEQSNTGNAAPSIDISTEHKAVNFRAGDWITVYEISDNREPVTINYNAEHKTITLSLDFLTSVSHDRLVRIVAEARRIIHKYRRNTLGLDGLGQSCVWAKWGIRSTPADKTSKNFYRKTVDIELRWRYDTIVD